MLTCKHYDGYCCTAVCKLWLVTSAISSLVTPWPWTALSSSSCRAQNELLMLQLSFNHGVLFLWVKGWIAVQGSLDRDAEFVANPSTFDESHSRHSSIHVLRSFVTGNCSHAMLAFIES